MSSSDQNGTDKKQNWAWSALVWAWEISKPIRSLYSVIAIISVLVTAGSLTYYDYFDHRKWTNERIAEKYEKVESAQRDVLELAVKTIPSRSNKDRFPPSDDAKKLKDALVALSVAVSEVDVVGSDFENAANIYRQSISNFVKALVRLNKDNPKTYYNLQLSADGWDKAAKTYSTAVEKRINSYFLTLFPST